jgi:hypothetical protein
MDRSLGQIAFHPMEKKVCGDAQTFDGTSTDAGLPLAPGLRMPGTYQSNCGSSSYLAGFLVDQCGSKHYLPHGGITEHGRLT